MYITIRRDGLIAIDEHGEEVRYADREDPLAILPLLRAHTSFEENLTLRQLMKALQPWSDVLGKLAWMDFDAWLKAADRTHISSADADEEPLSYVEIYSVFDVYRGSEKSAKVDVYWDYHGKYAKPVDDGLGRLIDCVSLSFSDPHTFANLPIVINATPSVHDIDVGPHAGKRPVIHESLPGDHDRLETSPTLFDSVILGLLDKLSFYGDPEDCEEKRDNLIAMVQEIKSKHVEREEHETDQQECESDTADSEPSHARLVVDNTEAAKEKLEYTADEFLAAHGISFDRERSDAAYAIYKAMRDVNLPDESLADQLRLTQLGLEELKAGIFAHLSTDYLIDAQKIIEGQLETKTNNQKPD